jgi:hypothetical protein
MLRAYSPIEPRKYSWIPLIKNSATIIVGISDPINVPENSVAIKDQKPSIIPTSEKINLERSAMHAGMREELPSPLMAVSIKTNGVAFDLPNCLLPQG